MTLVWAFAILCVVYAFAQCVSSATKGIFGSALVATLVMTVLFWTKLIPTNIVPVSNMAAVNQIMAAVIITNIGASFDPRMLKRYWRLTVTVLTACVGLTVLALGVGRLLVGSELALACYPTLLGGIQATRLVMEALTAKGLDAVAAIVLIVQNVQAFIGMPMIGLSTRRASRTLLESYRAGENLPRADTAAQAGTAQAKPKLIDRLPAKYDNPFIHLAILSLVSGLSTYIGGYTIRATNGVIGYAIIAIILGVIARQLGVIVAAPIQKAGLMTFFMFSTVMNLASTMSALSPAGLLENIMPIAILLILGGIGLFGGGYVMSKVTKVDTALAIAASFGAYTGYPVNYQTAMDAIYNTTQDAAERKYLEDNLMVCVVLGSVISVTITSVIMAGIVTSLV